MSEYWVGPLDARTYRFGPKMDWEVPAWPGFCARTAARQLAPANSSASTIAATTREGRVALRRDSRLVVSPKGIVVYGPPGQRQRRPCVVSHHFASESQRRDRHRTAFDSTSVFAEATEVAKVLSCFIEAHKKDRDRTEDSLVRVRRTDRNVR